MQNGVVVRSNPREMMNFGRGKKHFPLDIPQPFIQTFIYVSMPIWAFIGSSKTGPMESKVHNPTVI